MTKALLLLSVALGLVQVEADYRYLGDRTLYTGGQTAVFNIPIDVPELAAEVCDNADIYCDKNNCEYKIDGSCNPPHNPYTWAAGQKFKRIFGGHYDVGPVFHSKTINSMPFHSFATMPNPRHLSSVIQATQMERDPSNAIPATALLPAFTQVVLNDISLSPNEGEDIDCCGDEKTHYESCAAFKVLPTSDKEDDDICHADMVAYNMEVPTGVDCYVFLDGVDVGATWKMGNVPRFGCVSVFCNADPAFIDMRSGVEMLLNDKDENNDEEGGASDEAEGGSTDQEDSYFSTPEQRSTDLLESIVEGATEGDENEGGIKGRTTVPTAGTTTTASEVGFRFYLAGTEHALTAHPDDWRCKNVEAPEDWHKKSFDDSEWVRAEHVTGTDYLWYPVDAGEYPYSVYCRHLVNTEYKRIRVSSTGSLAAWVDGVDFPLPNNATTELSDTFYFHSSSNVLALRVSVESGETAAVLLDSNCGLKSGTDQANWKCLPSTDPNGPVDWERADFNDNPWLGPATATGVTTTVAGIPHTDWIQGQTGFTYPYLFCRITLHAHEVCINYKRNLPFCGDPGTSRRSVREQVNVVTGSLDMSFLYGSTAANSKKLRSDSGGKMRYTSNGACLPNLPTCASTDPTNFLRMSGDNLHSTSLHVEAFYSLFLAEHNRITDLVQEANDRLSNDCIWRIARQINIAQYQSIIYRELLPTLLGDMAVQDFFTTGSEFTPSKLSGVYHSAVLGLKGIIASATVDDLCTMGAGLCSGGQTLADFYQARATLTDELDPCHEDYFNFMGSTMTSTMRGAVDDDLYCMYNQLKEDVLARLIQEGRDVGMVGYNQIRNFCGLASSEPTDLPYCLYDHPDNIDFIVGALLEVTTGIGTTSVGETLSCVLSHQFKLLAAGDKNFFTHTTQQNDDKEAFKPIFSSAQRTNLMARTLSDVMCDNLDRFESLSPFIPPNNAFVMDLGTKDCASKTELDVESFVESWVERNKVEYAD